MAHMFTNVAEYAIIVNDKEEFLLVQWKAEHGFTWHFPGGRLDEGEKEIEGLVREIKEEIGLDINDFKIVYTKFIPKDYTKDINKSRYAVFYLAKIKLSSEIKLNEVELQSYKWFKKTDINNIKFWMPFYKEMLEKVLPF